MPVEKLVDYITEGCRGRKTTNLASAEAGVHVQVFKRKDEDADSVWGLSTAKKGGKKGKKGADRKPDQPVRTLSCFADTTHVH